MVKEVTIADVKDMVGFSSDMVESIGCVKNRVYITLYSEDFDMRCGYVSVLNTDPDIDYRKGDITYVSSACPVKDINGYTDDEIANAMSNTRTWIGFDWLVHANRFSCEPVTNEECVNACINIINNIDKI